MTYGEIALVDAGVDAGSTDADASTESTADGGALLDGGAVTPPVGPPPPPKYMTAYGTFYPTDLTLEYLGDVGDRLTSPQSMGITVPAGETIDVVVYAVENSPAGVGAYTLSCSTQ